MKRHARFIAVLCVVTNAGCAITPTFTTGYRVEPQALREAPLSGTLAVKRFVDDRPPRKYTTQGRAFLTYVPLLPYVTLDFERIDESVPLLSEQIVPGESVFGAVQNRAPEAETYAYPQSMAQAVAADLAAHNLFREVVYVGDGSTEPHDYVLSGKLRETPLHQYVTSYLLGAPGVLLWLLPVPNVKSGGGIALDLAIIDARTQTSVWEETIELEISRIDSMYTSQGIIYGGGVFSFSMIPPPSEAGVDHASIFAWHFEALRQGMDQARPHLAAALASRGGV